MKIRILSFVGKISEFKRVVEIIKTMEQKNRSDIR